jgi:hypothetical protein
MKILMLLTSHDQLGNTDHKTGFWRKEFAAPYGQNPACSTAAAKVLIEVLATRKAA